MDAVGYLRLNQNAAADESVPTLAEQESAFLRFCEAQGFQPAGAYIDPEADGPSGQRGYLQLLDFLNAPGKRFLMVAVSRPQELAGDPREGVRRLLELEYLGAQVAWTLDGDTPPVEAFLALWRERRAPDERADRAMDALRSKAMRGYGLGKTPLGYRIGASGKLEVVPEEAAVVQRIFSMYLDRGLGLRLIARDLNDAEIPTRRGSRWSVVTVRDILRNRVYTGTYARFGVRVPGSHPSIVSADVFRQAQQRREGAAAPRSPGRETAFALAGLAYCAACGGRMIGVSRKQAWSRKRDGGRTEAEYRYYRCGSRVNQSVCSYHTWRADHLERALLDAVEAGLDGPDAGVPLQEPERLAATAKQRLRGLDGRFSRHVDGAAKGLVSYDQLRTLAVPLVREMRRLEARLRVLDGSPGLAAARAALLDQRRDSARALREQWGLLPAEDQRLLLRDIIERALVHDERVEVLFS